MIRTMLAALAALLLLGAHAPPAQHVLIFSHTTGYRHAAIEPGRDALARDLEARGYSVTTSEDPALFTDAALAQFDAILLLDTTTDPRDPASEWLAGERGVAFQRWFRARGAVVGIHAAADSHYGWPWYAAMLGSQFVMHPQGTPEALVHARPGWGLAAERRVTDEWYRLGRLAADADVLVSLDSASIGQEGGAWPVSYTHRFEGRRVFYTSLGHVPERYAEPAFLDHVAAGLAWTLGRD